MGQSGIGSFTEVEAAHTAALLGDESQDPVAVPSQTVQEQAARWKLPTDLLGGTLGMRGAGELWLPKEEKEGQDAYVARLRRTFLFPAYALTWDQVCSKPFERPVQVVGDVPAELEAIEINADKQGNTLTDFARQLQKAAHLGMALIVVDFPANASELDLQSQRDANVHPYFALVRAEQLRGWRERSTASGAQELSMLRYAEHVTEPDGPFGEKLVFQVRVWYAPEGTPEQLAALDAGRLTLAALEADGGSRGRWEVWRKVDDDRDEMYVHEHGSFDFPAIPVVTHYTRRDGFMRARPPLEDLAWKNLEHYQSGSDQRHILRYLRFALLFQAGVTDEEMEKKTQVGPVAIIRTTSSSSEASLEYVEHTGKGVEAGENDLRRLRDEMESMGLQALMRRTGSSTATGEAIDESRQVSQVKAWVRGLEQTLRACYSMAARWLGLELADDFKLDVWDKFTLSLRAEGDLGMLLKLWQTGAIDHLTLLEEVQLRGLLDEHRDLEDVMALAADESSSKGLGLTGLGFEDGSGGDDDDDDDDDDGSEGEVDDGGSGSGAA